MGWCNGHPTSIKSESQDKRFTETGDSSKVGMKSDTQESEISFQNKRGVEINSLKKLILHSLHLNNHLNLLNIKMCNRMCNTEQKGVWIHDVAVRWTVPQSRVPWISIVTPLYPKSLQDWVQSEKNPNKIAMWFDNSLYECKTDQENTFLIISEISSRHWHAF